MIKTVLKRIHYAIYSLTVGLEHKLVDMENEKLSKQSCNVVCYAFKNGKPLYRAGDPVKTGKKFKPYPLSTNP